MQIKENLKEYDVVIVGSGAGGGMATKILSEAGLEVAVVEAGSFFDPADSKYRTQLRPPWESPRRGAGTNRVFGDFDAAYGGFEIEGEPYTQKNSTKFDWFRSHMLGGRTNHWGRISLRFGPDDFKRGEMDGLGESWPIGYEDVKPYYDKVDRLIGIFGSKEGIRSEPDGFFLPAPKPRLHELYYINAGRKLNIPVIPSRLSMLTKRINDERGVCFYCGQCNRACQIYADFSSGTCLILPAKRGGKKVTIYTDAVVREVTTNEKGKATGVLYVDKNTKEINQIKGKVIVLAASACSSARILLNSKSNQHKNGLGNSSGLIGHYLHDSTGMSRMAFIPQLMNRKMTYNEDGVGGMHVYTPWWIDNKKVNFPRGYHIEVWGGMGMPNYGFGFGLEHSAKLAGRNFSGYGNKLRDEVKRYYGAFVGFGGRGESIPMKDNYCEIDPDVVDKWGIPVLRFHYKWTEHERRQAKHMNDTFEDLFDAMGGKILGEAPKDNDNGLATPGRIIHEVGTVRMGNSKATSVTNKYNQLHDVDNVFVVDGGPFVSQADKNPTWTILALSWRASEYIIKRLKNQNI